MRPGQARLMRLVKQKCAAKDSAARGRSEGRGVRSERPGQIPLLSHFSLLSPHFSFSGSENKAHLAQTYFAAGIQGHRPMDRLIVQKRAVGRVQIDELI